MVYGATGAIGSAAVQLLKHFGTTVTAVCNTKNVSLVKSLGADVVIDYQTQDFTKTETRFNFIFDAVGKSSFKQCKPLLTEKGVYISTELGKNAENIFYALFTPMAGGKKVLFPIPTIKKEDVIFLKELVEKTPPGVIEMLSIKGLGPKKVRQLWLELSLESVGELLYACNENRLITLKGFGEKTQKAIKSSIEFKLSNNNKFHYSYQLINLSAHIVLKGSFTFYKK